MSQRLDEIRKRLEEYNDKTESPPFIQDGIMRPGWMRDSQKKLSFINHAPADLAYLLRRLEIAEGALKRVTLTDFRDDAHDIANQALAEMESMK